MTNSSPTDAGELEVAGLKRVRWHQIQQLLRHESDHWIFELLDDHWLRLYQHPIDLTDAGRERFEQWSNLDPSRRVRAWEYDTDPETGLVYLVHDAVKGYAFSEIALAPLVSGPGMPSLEARQIAEAFAEVLELLEDWHSLGRVHGDLRPSNLFWSETGCQLGPPLFEFGEGGEFRGETALYAAPEILKGESDPRYDVFSIGLAMYRVLTGGTVFDELPKTGRDTSPAQLLEELRGAGKRLELLYPSRVDRSVRGVIATATSLEPADRYSGAAELRTALLDALVGVGAPLQQGSVDEEFEEPDELDPPTDRNPIPDSVDVPDAAGLWKFLDPKIAALKELPRWVYGMTGAAFLVGIFVGAAVLSFRGESPAGLDKRERISAPAARTLPPVSAAPPTAAVEVPAPPPEVELPPVRDAFGPEAEVQDARVPEAKRESVPATAATAATGPAGKPAPRSAPAQVKPAPAPTPSKLSWAVVLPAQRSLQLRLGEVVTLRAQPSETAEVRWFVNASEAGTGNEFRFSAESAGGYEVRALAFHEDGRLAPRLEWAIAVAE